MSWSVDRKGRAKAVRERLTQDFASIHLVLPEAAIKDTVAKAVDIALSHMPDAAPVHVKAGGSQSALTSGKAVLAYEYINSVSVTIEPIYNFLD